MNHYGTFPKTPKQYNNRNFIVKTLLNDIKREMPYSVQSPDDFFPKHERIIKSVLDDRDTTVLLCLDGENITPYGGPFNVTAEQSVKGYALINSLHNYIYACFTSLGTDDSFLKPLLLERAYTHLGKPDNLYLPFVQRKLYQLVKRFCDRKKIKLVLPNWVYRVWKEDWR